MNQLQHQNPSFQGIDLIRSQGSEPIRYRMCSTTSFANDVLQYPYCFTPVDTGRAGKLLLGVGCTCSSTLLLTANPSPAAVTTSVAMLAAIGAVEVISVRVSLFVLVLAGGVCGFADHFAVTPAGNLLSE